MTDLGKAVKNIEQSDAWEEAEEVVELKLKKPLNKVIHA